MFFEVAGLGLLIPLFKVLSDPEFVNDPLFSKIFTHLKIEKNQALFFLLGIILFANMMKTLFLILLNHKQLKILNELNANLAVRLFSNFLHREQENFQKTNSALMEKKINSDTNHFTTLCTTHVNVIVETTLVISIFLTVIFIDPFSIIVAVSFLAILSIIFFTITKGKILKWGIDHKKFEEKMHLDIIEGLRAFKEISLYNAENYFVKKFKKHRNGVSFSNTKVQTINVLPRYFLEFISILFIVIFLFFAIHLNQSLSELISILGLIVAAIFKSLPSVNKILSSLQNIRYFSSSVDAIKSSLKEADIIYNNFNDVKDFDFNKDLILNNICFKYEESDKYVIKNLNLKIKPGSSIGIVGESGAGKSTLVDLLVGFLKPSKGIIKIGDQEIKKNINFWKKSIGYVSQEIFLIDKTILENIAFGLEGKQFSKSKLINAITFSGLNNYINSLPNKIKTKVGEAGSKMSGGQRQRIGLARAIYKEPKLLILDEATSALDSKTEDLVLNSIFRNNDKTIIIIAHKISSLRYCDEIYELKNGSLIQKSK